MTDYNREEATYAPREKYGPKFTAVEVRALREERDCGLVEAKQILMRQQILEDLKNGRRTQNTTLLYDILEYMIENRHV